MCSRYRGVFPGLSRVKMLYPLNVFTLRHTAIGFALAAPIQRAVRGAPFLGVRIPLTDVRMEIKVERPTADEADKDTQGWGT